ncbi:SsgA family sporulation/cell division regulator [Streptomyces sp. NPDC046985]|uniref:SsgA family sporulation/cell division regulator n=1 Tax=Streptomyces sp. NPDC046985 TaxID=3155377 RepID=UPI003405040D
MSVVEQCARARVLTDDDRHDPRAVSVILRYDPESDPRSVRVWMPGPREWTFARSLLEQGLRTPVGTGEVRVWPCGRVQVVVEFHSARGVSVVQFETRTLLRFLSSTYAAAATRAAEPVLRR